MSCSNAQHAFVQHLFERYRASLLGHVVNLLATTADAEDVVQETYARLLAVDSLEKHEARARSYMFRIATNLAFDRYRRRREQSIEELGRSAEPISIIDGPDAILDFDRALEAITQTLLQIRPRSRQVFLLRTAEDLSYESIAERLGVSKRTVEREMKHALDACQRKLRRSTE